MSSKPAEKLLNETIEGWKVVEKLSQKSDSGGKYSNCYKVKKGDETGFLKAFDYSDLIKEGSTMKKIASKFEREKDLLKRCTDKQIDNVITFVTSGKHFVGPVSNDTLVEYFIIEFCDDGNVEDQNNENKLVDLEKKFGAIKDMFDGLNSLHSEGIMHLDMKPSNLVHFISDEMTKIVDFGSARKWVDEIDEELQNDTDRILVTRGYAPPEYLYGHKDEKWEFLRRKIDLYLAGGVIVKLFTNYSYTAYLKTELYESESWNNHVNQGKLMQQMPKLERAAARANLQIRDRMIELNESSGNPLSSSDINKIVECVKELCHPNYKKRGYPKVIENFEDKDGLDRYRDRFIRLQKIASYKLKKDYHI